jgi:hypothetical protein
MAPSLDHGAWSSAIRALCPALDDEIVSYLSHLAIDQAGLQDAAAALTAAFLDFDAAHDQSSAESICARLFDRLGLKPVKSLF